MDAGRSVEADSTIGQAVAQRRGLACNLPPPPSSTDPDRTSCLRRHLPTVLVVDDNHDNAEIIRQYLEAQGYPVSVAHSGDEALSLFETLRPSLVLLDVMMPGRDGWEVCRLMKQHPSLGRGVRVIMVTALDQWDDKRQALQTGADDYVTKPFDLPRLVRHGGAKRGSAPGRGVMRSPAPRHDRVNATGPPHRQRRRVAFATRPDCSTRGTVVVRRDRELAAAVEDVPDVRVVVTTTDNPNALRDIVERARARALPVIVGCATTRRAAARSSCAPTSGSCSRRRAEEIAARVRSALARMAPAAAALADRIERVEYEQMLYDSLTGLPTLPVMIERSRAADQGARRAGRAVLQLRALLEDRGDLRVGEARRGARDDGAGGARVPRRERRCGRRA